MQRFTKPRKLRWRGTPYPVSIKARSPVHGTEDEEDSIGVVAVSMQYSSHQGKVSKAKDQMHNPLQQRISRKDKSSIHQEDIAINAIAARDGDICPMIAPPLNKAVFVVATVVVVVTCEEERLEVEEEEEICNEAEDEQRQ